MRRKGKKKGRRKVRDNWADMRKREQNRTEQNRGEEISL
jgi:hypothetical protein